MTVVAWARSWVLCLALATAASADQPPARASGLQRDVEFLEYAPLASSAEIVRRLMSPLTGWRVARNLAQSGASVNGYPVDLQHERFTLYVPAVEPPQGFALLVFLPPWEDGRLPLGWASTLERHNTIFVTPARSGNSENILDRRVPLALLAAHNVILRYHVDPQRVYVGGFSGGSRVALRVALGYPDVFRGAFLNAGSDPIGHVQTPLPPATLFRLFQETTRLRFITGQDDSTNIGADASSILSMRNWCVFNTESEVVVRQGHDVATAAALQRGLRALGTDSRPNPEQLAACRARLDEELGRQLRRIDATIAAGELQDAQKQLETVDAHFGGYAFPRSVALAAEIEQKKGAPATR